MDRRVSIINALILFAFFAIFFRLLDLMVLKHQRYSNKAANQRIKKIDIQAKRGLIFDRAGRRVAVNLEYDSIYFSLDKLKMNDGELQHVSRIVNVHYKDVISRLKKKRNFVWLKRKVPVDVSEKIKKLKIGGIGMIPDAKRYYQLGKLASHIVGFVDIDNKGLEGVELE